MMNLRGVINQKNTNCHKNTKTLNCTKPAFFRCHFIGFSVSEDSWRERSVWFYLNNMNDTRFSENKEALLTKLSKLPATILQAFHHFGL